MALESSVGLLGASREQIERVNEQICQARSELNESELGRKLADLTVELAEELDHAKQLEQEIREAALKVYGHDGTRKIHPAVQVKLYTVVDYDPKLAKAWCMHKYADGLRLDRRIFEKVAKALEPGFVEVTKEPRATIARDLSKYAGEE